MTYNYKYTFITLTFCKSKVII